jgi:O-antigen/teichoic acid export membrane protein
MKNLLWLGSSFIGNGLLSVFVISILTRVLEPHDYGNYSLVISGASLVNAIFFQWIRIYALRNIPGQSLFGRIHHQAVIFIFLRYAVNSIVICCILFFAFDSILKVKSEISFALVFLIGLLQGLYELYLAHERAQDKIKSFSLISITRACLVAIFCFSSITYVSNYQYYALYIACAYALTLIIFLSKNVSFLNIKLLYKKLEKTPSLPRKEVINISLYPTISVVTTMAFYFLFKFYAKNTLSPLELGALVAKFDIYLLLFITCFMMGGYIYQNDLVKAYRDKSNKSLYKKSFLILQYVKFVVFVSFIIFSTFFLNVLIGKEFVDNRYDLIFLLGFSFFILAVKQNWLDHSFYLLRNYKVHAISNITTLVVFIVSNMTINLNDPSINIVLSFFISCVFSFFLAIATNFRFSISNMYAGKVILSMIFYFLLFYIGFLIKND